jgi:hypothetical protein
MYLCPARSAERLQIWMKTWIAPKDVENSTLPYRAAQTAVQEFSHETESHLAHINMETASFSMDSPKYKYFKNRNKFSRPYFGMSDSQRIWP